VAVTAFHANKLHKTLNILIIITDVIIVFIFLFYPIYLLVKKNTKKSAEFFAVQLIIFIACAKILHFYEIDSDRIDFMLNKHNYKLLIQNSTPFKNEDGKRIFLINIESHYLNCNRYLVYDEGGEFIDPKNEFFGIGYSYATDENGKKFHSSNSDVDVKKYDDYMYIADVCHGAYTN
jgi:hypothetical protein